MPSLEAVSPVQPATTNAPVTNHASRRIHSPTQGTETVTDYFIALKALQCGFGSTACDTRPDLRCACVATRRPQRVDRQLTRAARVAGAMAGSSRPHRIAWSRKKCAIGSCCSSRELAARQQAAIATVISKRVLTTPKTRSARAARRTRRRRRARASRAGAMPRVCDRRWRQHDVCSRLGPTMRDVVATASDRERSSSDQRSTSRPYEPWHRAGRVARAQGIQRIRAWSFAKRRARSAGAARGRRAARAACSRSHPIRSDHARAEPEAALH